MPSGSVRHWNLFRAIVAKKARLIYEEVRDLLERTGPMPHIIHDVGGLEAQVRLLYEGGLRLKKFRTAQVALELETIEAEPLVEDGIV
ncbi:MAG: hypothetical protein WCF90_00465 [Methanomicrobiales archaeon]